MHFLMFCIPLENHSASTIRHALSCVRELAIAKLEQRATAAMLLQARPQLYTQLLQIILRTLLVETFPSGILNDAGGVILHLMAAEPNSLKSVAQVELAKTDALNTSACVNAIVYPSLQTILQGCNPRVTERVRSAFQDLMRTNNVSRRQCIASCTV